MSSSAPTNQAAWLDAKNQQLRIGEADMPKAGAGEIVIRNRAVAVAPVDWKIQDYGLFVQKWPFILGCDVAGEVVEIGEGAREDLKKGDRVIAHVKNLTTNDPRQGGFQLYSVVAIDLVGKLPENVSFAEGSVVPLAFDTAMAGLSEGVGKGLGLALPSLDPKPSGKTVVVWGGSSSVGAFVLQLAMAGGHKVVAVASKRNFEFCKSCGATEVYDYNQSSIVEDVIKSVKTLGGDFAGVYDCISTPDSLKHVFPIVEKLGGGTVAITLPGEYDVPAGVKIANVFGFSEITHPFWRDYVPVALKEGKLKCLPKPQVIGKGLEFVQAGLDMNKKGVSAAKIVIEL